MVPTASSPFGIPGRICIRTQLQPLSRTMAITVSTPVPHPDDESVADEQPAGAQVPPAPHTPHHQMHLSTASTVTVDIEAWTVQALESLSVSPIARGTGAPLSIPLDLAGASAPKATTPRRETPKRDTPMKLRNVVFDDKDDAEVGFTPPGRPPSRRDSMRHREALLKGNEGSRQRRRWENGTSHLTHRREKHRERDSKNRAVLFFIV